MLRKPVYLGEQDQKAIEIIVEAGRADSLSGAVRIALRQFAATLIARPPVATPTTPLG